MQDNIILNIDGKEVEVFSFQVAHIISKPEESKNILVYATDVVKKH